MFPEHYNYVYLYYFIVLVRWIISQNIAQSLQNYGHIYNTCGTRLKSKLGPTEVGIVCLNQNICTVVRSTFYNGEVFQQNSEWAENYGTCGAFQYLIKAYIIERAYLSFWIRTLL